MGVASESPESESLKDSVGESVGASVGAEAVLSVGEASEVSEVSVVSDVSDVSEVSMFSALSLLCVELPVVKSLLPSPSSKFSIAVELSEVVKSLVFSVSSVKCSLSVSRSDDFFAAVLSFGFGSSM